MRINGVTDMLEWNADYLTGVEEIDLQHQYFLKLINRIEAKLASIVLNHGHNSLLKELVLYARFHFISEENFMAEAGFPELEQHSQLHNEIAGRLNSEIQMLEMDMVEPMHIVMWLSDWFREHTLVEDQKYALYLKSR